MYERNDWLYFYMKFFLVWYSRDEIRHGGVFPYSLCVVLWEYMMMSSKGIIFRVTGHRCGEFIGHRWIPTQRPVTRSFDAFFDLRPKKWLSKQWRRWWFEMLSRSLWRHCNENYEWIKMKYRWDKHYECQLELWLSSLCAAKFIDLVLCEITNSY